MQRLQERAAHFNATELFEEIDRFLASIEERLPAVPAAGIKVQRAVNARMRDVVEDATGRFRTTTADDTERLEKTEDAVADEVEDAVANVEDDVAPDYTSMTKAELYELAQARDLEGRSSMNKAELVAALGNS